MTTDEYEELLRRLVVVAERMEARQADMQSLLGSLNTKYQRLDVSLIYVDEAMGKQTALLSRTPPS